MAYRVAAIPNDLQDHVLNAGLLKCDFSYMCVVDKTLTNITRRAVPL